jgi:hypothetical protein
LEVLDAIPSPVVYQAASVESQGMGENKNNKKVW